MSDFLSVLIWWLTIFFIGISLYPLTRIIFSKFIDHGYIFSKVLGIFILSYIIWFAGVVKILPFFKESLLLILIALAAVNFWIYKKGTHQNQDNTPKGISLTFAVVEELLFLGGIAFWSFVRGSEPSIRGLEKFMDFGFVSSILRSTYFPPLDMWLTHSPDYTGGYFINYYYFGHLVTAVLTKLSGINALITYNLAIATLFAFTFTLTFSIGSNLLYFLETIIKKELKNINFKLILVGGFLAAFIVALGGNLHTIYTFTTGYPNESPVPFWKIPFGFHPESYWYPNATRFIPYTIHEFPIYSFVVADLHGHVSDIPFVLLTLALLLNLLVKNKEPAGDESENKGEILRGEKSFEQAHRDPETASLRASLGRAQKDLADLSKISTLPWLQNFLQEFQTRTSVSFPYLLLLGILLAVMYMTNAVDGLIYMVLTGLVILYKNWQRSHNLKKSITQTFSASLFLLFFFLLGGLPFSLYFKPFGTGIGVLCAPASLLGKHFGPILFEEGKCQKSPWWMLMILWGFFYYNVIGFLILNFLPSLKLKISSVLRGGKFFEAVSHRDPETASLRASLGRAQKNLADLSKTGKQTSLFITDIFIILTTIISTLLLIFPEFFYIKDIYPMHYRANTMFKLGYQAFIMLGIDSAYIFLRIKHMEKSLWKILYLTGFTFVFFLIAIYPFFAINSYYGALKTYHGLDGLQWMKQQYPSDYEGVIWLRENVTGQPVLLEANGESYTDYARISGNTGLPTVIGWPVHEWLWRGSYDEAGRRIPEVQALYESKDLSQTRQLLQKYNISYVFIGQLERQKYPNLDESKWNNLGKLVFQSGNTKIYKVKE